eukprot:14575556-Alexandrium_andersonii.AAC.1
MSWSNPAGLAPTAGHFQRRLDRQLGRDSVEKVPYDSIAMGFSGLRVVRRVPVAPIHEVAAAEI